MFSRLLTIGVAVFVTQTSPQQIIDVVPNCLEVQATTRNVSRAILPSTFQFSVGGASSAILESAMTRFHSILFEKKGIHDYGGDRELPQDRASSTIGMEALPRCSVVVQDTNTELTPATNESYQLNIGHNNLNSDDLACTITAQTVFGAMHGMETFCQLVRHSDMSVQPISIRDEPRFPL